MNKLILKAENIQKSFQTTKKVSLNVLKKFAFDPA